MYSLTTIQNIFGPSKKILNGLPNAITIEEIDEDSFYNAQNYKEKIKTFVEVCSSWNVKRASILLDKSFNSYTPSVKVLRGFGFQPYAAKIEVFRKLTDIVAPEKQYDFRSIAERMLSEVEFKSLWERCMSDSDNKSSILNIDEHFYAIQAELGEDWQKSCIAFYEKNKSIGIAIPHMEPGTKEEGRLFYFGLLPEERGKGLSAHIHLQSLHMLKQMGATYYIGSTHMTNEKMQKVFWKNGCSIKAETELYCKIFKQS
ncbi:GNAT family N-acetyltransferase [Bacillus pseudomycoides]|uniref:GNAT family N-acetyltransferase n=1 Tax=Bacillus pseudomycoides TaxID=64104 RepID=A0A2A8C1U2_9BACI|nr:GNAT family N-acetyltransferase [Bacillus pseudomycoides]PDY45999.1 GNAT family N-acetyltransferase [Bacillus pseudomycoides]PEA83451.1 GNAT family N-acetyltransferase [Bacillus pseudomycoides]PED69748.1 GNAT family N-acetyltransferase [Bacillus pseudomycoides]PEI36812.1 GNAT family N-acetyltransferase [Bacillus pseudomycoides]PEJ70172.1 GNAT family N-acetyltransferase [Bacillus pseudomycoides]